MKTIDYVKRKLQIDIDLEPTRDLIYSGVCLKYNKYIFLLLNFDECKKQYNGYTVFRNKEVNRYRLWDKNEKNGLKKNNSREYLNALPLGKMNTFYSCLNEAAKLGLIAFHTNDDDSCYGVGKITSINRKYVNFRLLDTKGKWLRYKKFKIRDINYFSFDTEYERKLNDKLHNKQFHDEQRKKRAVM